MTPSARIQAAIEILDALEKSRTPADRFLEQWGRAHRYAGAKDRAAIADRVYTVLRRRLECALRMGGCDDARVLVIGSLAIEGMGADGIAALFSGEGHAPQPLTERERAALAAAPAARAGGDYPPWLEGDLRAAFGARLEDEMAVLQARAPVDIRANLLKTDRASLKARLAEENVETTGTPLSPWGLRAADARSAGALERTRAFAEGLFEIQDEGSQLAALLCDARPGETVVDLCAGAGGKTLALAAMMNDHGRLIACDTGEKKLARLKVRAARAGATIVEPRPLPVNWLTDASMFSRLAGKADRVLIDAPCSGSGAWRRNPETKWRLDPQSLSALNALQGGLLNAAARLVRPGGTLVYVTCSLLASENEAQAESFARAHGAFEPMPVGQVWRLARLPPHATLGNSLRAQLSPAATKTDGFYIAIWRRAS